MTAPSTSRTLGVNVFKAPGKAMAGERPKPFGEALGFDPIASTLICGEYDAVLVPVISPALACVNALRLSTRYRTGNAANSAAAASAHDELQLSEAIDRAWSGRSRTT
jgi:hypothetical protein